MRHVGTRDDRMLAELGLGAQIALALAHTVMVDAPPASLDGDALQCGCRGQPACARLVLLRLRADREEEWRAEAPHRPGRDRACRRRLRDGDRARRRGARRCLGGAVQVALAGLAHPDQGRDHRLRGARVPRPSSGGARRSLSRRRSRVWCPAPRTSARQRSRWARSERRDSGARVAWGGSAARAGRSSSAASQSPRSTSACDRGCHGLRTTAARWSAQALDLNQNQQGQMALSVFWAGGRPAPGARRRPAPRHRGAAWAGALSLLLVAIGKVFMFRPRDADRALPRDQLHRARPHVAGRRGDLAADAAPRCPRHARGAGGDPLGAELAAAAAGAARHPHCPRPRRDAPAVPAGGGGRGAGGGRGGAGG